MKITCLALKYSLPQYSHGKIPLEKDWEKNCLHAGINSCFLFVVSTTIELHVIEGIPQLIFVRSSYTIEVCLLGLSLSPSNLLQFRLLSFSQIFLFLLFEDSRSWANFCWSCCAFETIWRRLCCYSTWVIQYLFVFQSGVKPRYFLLPERKLLWFDMLLICL